MPPSRESPFPSERAGMRRNVKDQKGWLVLSPQAKQIVVHTGHAVEEDDPESGDRRDPRRRKGSPMRTRQSFATLGAVAAALCLFTSGCGGSVDKAGGACTCSQHAR